jgi:uncharacterized membrane protein
MIAALGSVVRWSLFIAALAIGVHFMTLYYLPGVLMARTMSALSRSVGINTMAFPQRSDASTRLMTRPNPDVLISSCVFNLAQSRVQINAAVPREGQWSLTVYGEDARPFYFRTNQSGDATFSAVLIEPGGAAQQSGKTIRSPSFGGVILIRALIDDEASLAESDRVRHQASCRAIPR